MEFQTTFTTPDKGTYVLLLSLLTPARLSVGKLGTFNFPAGCYTYVGSAFGTGGLRGRLKHHLVPANRPHWHIDYLRQTASVTEIWYLASTTSCEHKWASALMRMSGVIIAPRFGASDCTCPAHIFHFSLAPAFDAFCHLQAVNPQRWIVPPT